MSWDQTSLDCIRGLAIGSANQLFYLGKAVISDSVQVSVDHSSNNPLDNALWQWSLEFYQRPGMAKALLELQDIGEDVLWLLYLAWCDESQSSPDLKPMPPMLRPSVNYQYWRTTMIGPIRQLRHRCEQSSPLRQQLLAAELLAEQQGMAQLFVDHQLDNIERMEASGASYLARHAGAQQSQSRGWQSVLDGIKR